MNITKLVASLQKAANTSTTAAELANLSRAIKGLNVGTVTTVANTASLPAMLPTNGNLYYVESEEDLYYNVGGTWNLFYTSSNAVYGWGGNSFGNLGDNTTSSRSSPVSTIGGITTWRQIAVGNLGHSLGITSTGIAYAWGINNNGRLGDNTTTFRSSPVSVVGGITNWSQVSAGQGHSLGIAASGLIYAWGQNTNGQLGDNTTSDRSSPVTVMGGIANWSQVSAGYAHSLGLISSGVVYGWGRNTYGQLGDNTTSSRSSPVTVVGGVTNWSQIDAGISHSIGLTSAGILYSWGYNQFFGALGDGTTTNRSSPVAVVGGITNWSRISAGGGHSFGTTSTGILYAWGWNNSGRLGDGTIDPKSSPITVVGGITNWSQVSAGSDHTLGLTSTGILYAWGSNSDGRLGDNTTSNRSSPVSVVGGITAWSFIAAGIHSLAINTTIL